MISECIEAKKIVVKLLKDNSDDACDEIEDEADMTFFRALAGNSTCLAVGKK